MAVLVVPGGRGGGRARDRGTGRAPGRRTFQRRSRRPEEQADRWTSRGCPHGRWGCVVPVGPTRPDRTRRGGLPALGTGVRRVPVAPVVPLGGSHRSTARLIPIIGWAEQAGRLVSTRRRRRSARSAERLQTVVANQLGVSRRSEAMIRLSASTSPTSTAAASSASPTPGPAEARPRAAGGSGLMLRSRSAADLYLASAIWHSSWIGRSSRGLSDVGRVTRTLATLMLKTWSRSGPKSRAQRASLVCSSMARRPAQPPHWTSLSAR